LALNILNELATIAYAKAHCLCLLMFTNIFMYHLVITWGWGVRSNWFQNTKTISSKTRTMAWRWNHDLRKPFQLRVKNEKEKKWIWEVFH
jgi:hypothetical protein